MHRSRAAKTVGSFVLAGAAMAMVGCGGDGPSEVDKFIGIWEYDLSSVDISCSDGTDTNLDGSLNHSHMELFAGITSDLVDTTSSIFFNTYPCDFRFKVASGTATIEAGQTCDIIQVDTTGAVQKIGTETPTTVTYGLRGDGTELQQDSKMAEAASDGSVTCATTITGHLKKIAKD